MPSLPNQNTTGPITTVGVLEIIPEDLPQEELNGSTDEDVDGKSLDAVRADYEKRELKERIAKAEQENKHNADIHELRRKHMGRLFTLTVVWIGIVWLVVLLQGFGRWFLLWPNEIPGESKILPFKLDSTVIVAFMTSTTATVLGLYGIAAYWLFGKNKPTEDKKAAKTGGAKKEKSPDSSADEEK